jgi:hypothetical protein
MRLSALKSKARRLLLDAQMASALRSFKRSGEITPAEMRRFRDAFSNNGFSAAVEYLLSAVRMLKSGPVLECGTGASTILAAYAGVRYRFETYSLEQHPEWAAYVRRFIPSYARVRIINAPLVRHEDYLWYDAPEDLPKHFPLVICDGPAIYQVDEPYLSGWRHGIMPWLSQTGRTFDTLLLDDVDDPRSQRVLTRWHAEFGVEVVEELPSAAGLLAIVKPRDAFRTAPT